MKRKISDAAAVLGGSGIATLLIVGSLWAISGKTHPSFLIIALIVYVSLALMMFCFSLLANADW